MFKYYATREYYDKSTKNPKDIVFIGNTLELITHNINFNTWTSVSDSAAGYVPAFNVTNAVLMTNGSKKLAWRAVSNKDATLSWAASVTIASIGDVNIKVALPTITNTVTSSSNYTTNLSITSNVNGTSSTASLSKLWTSYFSVLDIRGTDWLPNNTEQYPEKSLTALFNNTGMPTSNWYSGITVKGWTKDYITWQLVGHSHNADYDGNLYFRYGNAGTWKQWHTVLDNINSSVSGGGSTWGSELKVKINGTELSLKIPSNPNTDNTAVQVTTGSVGTTSTTGIVSRDSSKGLLFKGGTNKFSIGNGTNYFDVNISHGLSTKSLTVNKTSYNIYTSSSSLPSIYAPSSLSDTGGYILATKSDKTGLEWVAKPETNVSSALFVGSSTGESNSALSTNGNVHLIFKEGGTYTRYKITGSGGNLVTSNSSGYITIENSYAPKLVNNTGTSPGTAVDGLYLKWFSQISKTSDNLAGDSTGFPTGNNANGILWLGTHNGNYGHLIGVSANGELYDRTIANNSFTLPWKLILNNYNSSVTTTDSGKWGGSITVKLGNSSKTFTIPQNPNTDTKVTQSSTDASGTYPILLKKTANTTSETDSVNYSDLLYYNPSNGLLRNDGALFLRPGGDSTLKIYSGKITDGASDGFIKLLTSIDGTDGETSLYPTTYMGRCVLFLLPRGGEVYVGKDITDANTSAPTAYKLNVGGKILSTGYVLDGGTNTEVLLADGTKKSISNLYSLPTASKSTLGGVKTGEVITPTTGYVAVHIDENGVIYYKDTNNTYSFSNLTFQDSTGTSLMTYNSQAARTIKAGSNITFSHSNNVLTIASNIGVSSFGSKTGAITLRGSQTTNGAVNLAMSNNELQASIVGLGTSAYQASTYFVNVASLLTITGLKQFKKDLGYKLADWVTGLHSGPLEVGRNSNTMTVAIGVTDDDYGYILCKGNNITSNGNLVLLPGSGGLYYGKALNKIWHAGNDGASSGLDADLLDGLHGSYYATAASVTTLLGYFTNGVANSASNVSFPYSSLAHYGNTGNFSGKFFKISINATNSWMLSFVVRLYLSYSSYDIRFSGYNYGNNYWYSPSAALLDSTANSLEVYFGYDSALHLWVAVPGASYTGISVVNAVNGYSQAKLTEKDLFTISVVDSLSTIQTTQTIYRPRRLNEYPAQLQTVRNLKVNLASASAQSFNGTADATSIGVAGTLPFANLPTMYWANVAISNTSSTTATPQFANLGLGVAASNAADFGSLAFVKNKVAINFKPDGINSSYCSKVQYMTEGNEALVFAHKSSDTSYIFKCGYNLVDDSMWSKVGTPTLLMKEQSVYVNTTIATGVSPAYNFYVTGSSYFNGAVTSSNGFSKNGSTNDYVLLAAGGTKAISDFATAAWARAANKPTYTLDEITDGSTRKLSNYLPLSGGTLTGNLRFNNGLSIEFKNASGAKCSLLTVDTNNTQVFGNSSLKGLILRGGTDIKLLYGSSSTTALNISSTGTISAYNWVLGTDGRLAHGASTTKRNSSLYGVYNSNKLQQIWSMGVAYYVSDDGTSSNNLYGLAYFHTNWSNNAENNLNPTTNSLGVYASSHLLGWFIGGQLKVALGDNVWTSGKFIKSGGTSTLFLKADGSVDSTTYVPATRTIAGLKLDANITSASLLTAIGAAASNASLYIGTTSVSLGRASGALTLNGVTAAKATILETGRTIWGQSFNGSANVSGAMTTVDSITFTDTAAGNTRNLLYAKMAASDYFRILVGGASNAGYVELATADDANEPIYVRQYSGTFATVTRTLTLLDGSGNTTVPGTLTANSIKKSGSSDDYVLLAGGGTKALSTFSSGDFLSTSGGTVSGTITATKFITSGSSSGYFVLGDGSTTPVRNFAQISKLTASEYASLATKDPNTIYIVT